MISMEAWDINEIWGFFLTEAKTGTVISIDNRRVQHF